MNTHLVETSISGVRYMPCTFFTILSGPGNGPIGERNAPMLAKPVNAHGEERAVVVEREFGR